MINTTGKTLQQVSDEIAAVLIKQGKRCTVDEFHNQCAYGDKLGNHCAVGHLLPSSDTTIMDYEGSVKSMIRKFESVELGVNGRFINENIAFLKNIQAIHDTLGIINVADNINHLAKSFDLNVSAWDGWVEALNKQEK